MTTLNDVKNHPQILEFIKQTQVSMKALDYTEHGLRHANLVARRARRLAQDVGLSKRMQELSAIGGFCQDMGNFLGRTRHHYWGALLFHQVFQDKMDAKDLVMVVQALANHDKENMKLTNAVSAIVVIADKSDVHRSRVITRSIKKIKADIHDRVNYAVTRSMLRVDKKKKRIILTLKIDTNFVPIMEYFEIFTERMSYCRAAADYLGYRFSIVINNFKLL
ncbi:phosphohydrolase [Patescibacteria group bacterium AH-259-L07]|nr:phosphohydrolase [Patescibacteria group bacterium AH-259-L07]